MCGIAGFSRSPEATFNANALSRTMLLGIEERGRDATGAAWIGRRNDVCINKRPVKASDFVPTLPMDKRAKLGILHTRLSTQGSPQVNANNHPIVSGNLVGVHNGMVLNDRDLWKQTKTPRLAEVDSEALFAYLNDTTNLLADLSDIDASMAVAWFDRTEPGVLHLARGESSPLLIAQTESGSLIFASTWHTIYEALDTIGEKTVYDEEVKEGTYLRVKEGVITDCQTFDPMWGISFSQRRSAVRATTGGSSTKSSFPRYGNLSSGYYETSTGDLEPMPEADKPLTVITAGKPTTRNHGPRPTEQRFVPLDKLLPGAEIPVEKSRAMEVRLPDRITELGDWLEDHAPDYEDDTLWLEAESYGAFLTRGAQVIVNLNDGYAYDGVIWDLPNEFPGGLYAVIVNLHQETDTTRCYMLLPITALEPWDRIPVYGGTEGYEPTEPELDEDGFEITVVSETDATDTNETETEFF